MSNERRTELEPAVTPDRDACSHRGRVKPVVVAVLDTGEEVVNTVVCEQCWRAISADAPFYNEYETDGTGWMRPTVAALPRQGER